MATCEASWLDWNDDDVRMEQFISSFDRDFSAAAEDGGMTAKQPVTAFGHPVDKVYPQSIGMGLGFSLQLKSSLQDARESIEKRLGKKLECSTAEAMTSCGVELEHRKTVMVMANENPADKTSVVGCFYYYQQ